jgi:hypothetical protein
MTPFGSSIRQGPSESTVQCGGRRLPVGVDGWILGSEKRYGIPSGTVQSVNSLRGAVVVQGILLAMRLRERAPAVAITETHPEALLIARKFNRAPWSRIADAFKLKGREPSNMHRRDALLGAVAAREGASGRWRDLSLDRNPDELDPKHMWFGPITYWWPP